MTNADLHAVIPLINQLGYDCSLEALQKHYSHIGKDETVGLFVGISDEGQVIAFMQVNEHATLISGRRAELDSLVVDESRRGHGLGKKMVRAAEEWVRERKLSKLRLGSRTSRKEAHEFYKRYGFAIEKEWFVFSKRVDV